MDLGGIGDLVTKLAFPAAMCVLLMWWFSRREERDAKIQNDRELRLGVRLDHVQDEILGITRTVVSENTDAMRRMTHELGEIRAHCAGKHGVLNG